LLVQNSPYGYAALPHLKTLLPEIQTIDVIHSVDEAWDQVGSTSAVAANIDLRVAMSEAVRDRLRAAGTPEQKIVPIRNGVDLERFRGTPISGNNTILFAGRLDVVKRPLLVADIANAIAKLRPQRDFRFVIAGDGPERKVFERRVHKLGLENVFDFRGHVVDLAPLYAAADLVLLTSRSEGVPLVILEALASARPVVASNVGSISEVLDSSCGILISRDDAFAPAIHSLLNQPELRQKMGAAGRQKMESGHDIRKTRAALSSLFDQRASVSVSSTNRSTAIK
jgi:glycosyltransferase involved in cell wall biosynthesis